MPVVITRCCQRVFSCYTYQRVCTRYMPQCSSCCLALLIACPPFYFHIVIKFLQQKHNNMKKHLALIVAAVFTSMVFTASAQTYTPNISTYTPLSITSPEANITTSFLPKIKGARPTGVQVDITIARMYDADKPLLYWTKGANNTYVWQQASGTSKPKHRATALDNNAWKADFPLPSGAQLSNGIYYITAYPSNNFPPVTVGFTVQQ